MNVYTLTLGDVKANLGIRNISGVCPTSDQFVEQINAVTRRLMRRGNWWQTEVLMRVCFEGCRIVWPRQVGTVMGVRFCRGGMVQLKNNWWAIAGYCGDNRWGLSADVVGRDDDTAPCYNEVTGNTGKYIRWNVVKGNDVGKTMRIYGTQYGGQPLQELNSEGKWVPGITITSARPYIQTTILVTKITGIRIQGVTDGLASMEGVSYLYQVDPVTGDLFDLAVYQPGETTPDYRVTRFNNLDQICAKEDSYGRKIRQADALVKLQYIPAHEDHDFLMLSNLDAIKLGIQALRAEEANDDVQAEIKWSKSIKELNMEIRDRDPASKTVIRINDIGGDCGIYSAI